MTTTRPSPWWRLTIDSPRELYERHEALPRREKWLRLLFVALFAVPTLAALTGGISAVLGVLLGAAPVDWFWGGVSLLLVVAGVGACYLLWGWGVHEVLNLRPLRTRGLVTDARAAGTEDRRGRP